MMLYAWFFIGIIFEKIILSNEKQLCFYAILTPKHFTDILHTDRDSNLSPESDKKLQKKLWEKEKYESKNCKIYTTSLKTQWLKST